MPPRQSAGAAARSLRSIHGAESSSAGPRRRSAARSALKVTFAISTRAQTRSSCTAAKRSIGRASAAAAAQQRSVSWVANSRSPLSS